MNRAEVQKRIREIGLRPQKAAGQNFLLDEDVCREMIEIAEVTSSDTIVEVGPGLGVLTEPLLATGAHVIGIELDVRLANFLRHRLKNRKNFTLLESDVFKVNLHEHAQDFGYKVVANLPYGVTSLFFRNLVTLVPRPSRMTVMIQKEVAERMVAEPGKMSLLSLMIQHYTEATFVMTVPKTSFWPAPEVTSAIIDVRPIQPAPDPALSQAIFRLARTAFSGRRKTLSNSLTAIYPKNKEKVIKTLDSIGISPTARPQDLKLEEWEKMAQAFI